MQTLFLVENGVIRESAEREANLLVFEAPDDREKTFLMEHLDLDAYDVDSALDSEEVARLEASADHVFMIWKTPRKTEVGEQLQLGVSSVGFVIGENRLAIIMNEGRIPFSAREFRGANAPADVLLGSLLHTVRHYVGHLRVIKQLSTELEQKITTSMENRYLLQMFALSESLIYYVDAIEANGAVLDRLRHMAGRLALSEAQTELLDDIVLENRQSSRQAHIYSSVLSGLMDARGTIVNNNMNVLLKNLTLINIVFLPLNLIASIGGMSEWSMMTDRLDWRVSYALFSLGMVFFGFVTWILVVRLIEKRVGGFGRRRRFAFLGSLRRRSQRSAPVR